MVVYTAVCEIDLRFSLMVLGIKPRDSQTQGKGEFSFYHLGMYLTPGTEIFLL